MNSSLLGTADFWLVVTTGISGAVSSVLIWRWGATIEEVGDGKSSRWLPTARRRSGCRSLHGPHPGAPAHKRTSSPSTRLAPSNPAVSPLIRHGDGQAREQGRLEGQACVVQAQLLGLDAFGQEDCPLLPVTQRGSHDRSDQGGASIGALSCLLRLLRSSMCSVAKTTLLD